MMNLNLILTVLSAVAFGFFIGVSFPAQMVAPQVRLWKPFELNIISLLCALSPFQIVSRPDFTI